MDWESLSHYDVLQVVPTAPLSVIKASYKALIQQYHPDRHSPAEDAERITKRLNGAYAVLSDPELRAAYDAFLTGRAERHDHQATSSAYSEPPGPQVSDKQELHPWRRFFARVIDLLWLGLLLGFAVVLVAPDWAASANLYLLVLVLGALSLPIEALLVSTFGKTPGKWLFGIDVTTKNGSHLSYGSAFQRTLRAWLSGQALGLPGFSGIAYAYWFFSLRKNGTTSWDASVGSEVHHSNISFVPYVVGIAALFVSGLLTNMALRDNTERLIAASDQDRQPAAAAQPAATETAPQPFTGTLDPVAGEEYLGSGWMSLSQEQFESGVKAWFQRHPEYNNAEAQQAINSHFQDVAKQYPVIALGPALDMALRRALTAGQEQEYQTRQQAVAGEKAQLLAEQAAAAAAATANTSRRSVDNADVAFVRTENESFARMAAAGNVQPQNDGRPTQPQAEYPSTQAEIDARNQAARAQVESMSKANIAGAYKRYDYKSGKEIWVDANGAPLQ